MAISEQSQSAAAVATAYFGALARRDAEAMAALWAPGGVDHIAGQADLTGPDEVRAWFAALFAAFPDLRVSVVSQVAQDDHVAVHYHADGTFAGAPYNGMEPTGSRVRIEGVDLLRVRDGRIARNDAYLDGLGFARQLGLLPAAGSGGERRLTRAFNLRTRGAQRFAAAQPERIADGVWRLRGGFPTRIMNVYFIEDEGGGVTMFDAGIAAMTRAAGAFGAAMGGLNRVVLGHAHADHRGAAAGLDAPVLCHPDDRADAEGDGGWHYFDFRRLNPLGRVAFPHLLAHWDGGPLTVAGTVEEGDDVSGFRVVHVPGHAPGMIALVRERDGLALTTDCFYTMDPQTSIPGAARVPHPAFNRDTEQARESVRKLAGIPLQAAWPGHAGPVTGDVRGQLLCAADGA